MLNSFQKYCSSQTINLKKKKRKQTIILMSYFKVNFLCKNASLFLSLVFYFTYICSKCAYASLEDLQENLKDFHCSDTISNYIQRFECFFFNH